MCERRKINKGSRAIRLREARRRQRLERQEARSPSLSPLPSPEFPVAPSPSPELSAAPSPELPAAPSPPPAANERPTVIDKELLKRAVVALAVRTINLMFTHRRIQQRIIALQRETNEFMTALITNPRNRVRCYENARKRSLALQKENKK